MSDLEAKPIPGTMQDITTPFFSPDGNWIGFYAGPEGKLKKIAINGGASVEIGEIDNPYGATWYSQDSILVGQGTNGIIRVPAGGGGKPETVIPAKENEVLQTSKDIGLSDINHEPTVYLVPPFEMPEEFTEWLEEYCDMIFAEALDG